MMMMMIAIIFDHQRYKSNLPLAKKRTELQLKLGRYVFENFTIKVIDTNSLFALHAPTFVKSLACNKLKKVKLGSGIRAYSGN